MTRKFSELEATMNPESRERVKKEVAKALAKMSLDEEEAMGGEFDIIARFLTVM